MELRLYVLTLLIVLGTAYIEEKGVIVLKNADLANLTQTFPQILVYYYVPWCDHCKKFAPIYQHLAQQLQAEQSPITLAKVNCEQQEDAYEFGEIGQFPTIKYYNSGETLEFDGDRNLRYLYKWLTKRYQSPITKISRQLYNQLKAIQGEVKVVYLGSLQNSRGSQFTTLAYYDNYNDYYHLEEGVTSQEEGTIRIIRDFGQDFAEKVEQEKMQSWVRQHDRPQVVSLDQRSIFTVFVEKREAVLLFVEGKYKDKQKSFKEAANTWKTQKQAIFIVVEDEHEDFFGLMEYLQLNPLLKPVVYIDPQRSVKYIMEQSIESLTSANVLEFLRQVEQQLIPSLPLETHHEHDHDHDDHHHHHHHHDDHDHHHHHHHHHHDHDHLHDDVHHGHSEQGHEHEHQDYHNCNHPDHHHDHHAHIQKPTQAQQESRNPSKDSENSDTEKASQIGAEL